MGGLKALAAAGSMVVAAGIAAQPAAILWEQLATAGPDFNTVPVFLDLDGDGRNEVVYGGGVSDIFSGRFAITVLGGPSDTALERLQVRTLPLRGETLVAVRRIGQPDTLAVSVVDPSTGSSRLIEVGGLGLELLREVDLPHVSRIVQVDDIDGDGELEALAFAAQHGFAKLPLILDFSTLALEWQGSEPMLDGAAAQLDADPALEILLTDGQVGRVIDGASRLPEWSWPDGFGFEVIPGRFETDPLVAGFLAKELEPKVFRSSPYSPLRQLSSIGYGATPFDSDRDGIDEVFGASANPPNNLVRMSSQNGDIDVVAPLDTNRVAVAMGRRVDSGSPLAVVAAQDAWSWLRVLDVDAGEWVWNSEDNRGPLVQGVFLARTAPAPLRVAVLTRSASSEVPGSSLQIHDAETGVLVQSRPGASYGDNIQESRTLLSGDLDGVPGGELAIVDRANSGTWVSVLDGESLEERWRIGGFGSPISGTHTAGLMDFDNIPGMDVVLAMAVPNSWDLEIAVLSGADGSVVWRSAVIPRDFTPTDVGMALGNVDGQPGEEIVLATGPEVIAIDASTGLLRWTIPAGPGELFTGVVSWGSGERCRIGVQLQSEILRALDCNDRTLRESIALPVGAHEVMALDGEGLVLGAAAGDSYWLSVNGAPFTEALPDVGPLATVNGPSAILGTGAVSDFIMGSSTRMQRIRIDADVLFTAGFEGGGR